MAAYVEHAYNLGYENPEIFAFMQHALAELTREDITVDELITLTLTTGNYGVQAMAQLDTANTNHYGNPEISEVNIGVRSNPGILVSGHDLKDIEELLQQTEGTGIDIYTHSEMLPAHYYPRLKQYKHLVGNYGNAWWKQKRNLRVSTVPSSSLPIASFHHARMPLIKIGFTQRELPVWKVLSTSPNVKTESQRLLYHH